MFEYLLSAIRVTFEDPASNPILTAIVVGVFTVVLLVVVLTILIAYFILSRRGGEGTRVRLPVREITPREAAVSWLVILILLSGLYWSAESYITKPSTCAMCHTDNKQEKSLRKSAHSGVNCMACHQKPGATGALLQKLDYLRWVLHLPDMRQAEQDTNSVTVSKVDISDQACLRCHSDVERGVVSRRQVRMRHSDVIEAGYRCNDCHNTVAHLDTVANQKKPSMEKCIACHNGTAARSTCEICHGESKDQRRLPKDHVRRALPPPEDCRGCHNIQSQCTTCHGVEMPHSVEYKQRLHARDGFLKKDTCRRCHDEQKFCNKCHQFPSPHGLSQNWKNAHGAAANTSNFSTYWPKVDELIRGCNGCHRGNMCGACHNDDGRSPVKPDSVHQR